MDSVESSVDDYGKDITPSAAALKLFAEFYETNWIRDFDNAPQSIVFFESNCCCVSVPLTASIVCENVRNWSEFAERAHNDQYIECHDEEGEPIQFASAKDYFMYVIDPEKQLDSYLFVTRDEVEKNRILRWVSHNHSHHMATSIFDKIVST